MANSPLKKLVVHKTNARFITKISFKDLYTCVCYQLGVN